MLPLWLNESVQSCKAAKIGLHVEAPEPIGNNTYETLFADLADRRWLGSVVDLSRTPSKHDADRRRRPAGPGEPRARVPLAASGLRQAGGSDTCCPKPETAVPASLRGQGRPVSRMQRIRVSRGQRGPAVLGSGAVQPAQSSSNIHLRRRRAPGRCRFLHAVRFR